MLAAPANGVVARHERGVGERTVQSDGEVTELVQVVGTDVEQILPGIVGGRAVVDVDGVVEAADASCPPGPVAAWPPAAASVQLGRVTDTDLQAGKRGVK